MTLRLHIDRLVVDAGLGAAAADGPRLRAALEAELARLLAEEDAGWAPSEAWRVQAAARFVPRGGDVEAMGAEIAGTLHACLHQRQGEMP
ncbi:hypothetical protein E2493_17545 [Sphingomonas parva]|uniref:Uncharacterized protein n=1 Tax=Sphingomonas parva TaxID=2555898 RepID=A0A4Y8ZLP6_9SPHN|nr:hypothetical protein [Sphingomonas parva]TFI56930.1 hypothetical protein E2493_17545 [Sphingomonas parva]